MTGQPAFDHAHGIDFMAYMITDGDFADRFNEFMSEVTERVAAAVVDRADLAGAKTFVDIGGGAGALLRAILRAHPHARGTILDVALLREQAERSIAADGLGDRCAFAAGDFFRELPPDADVYLLKSVLHDWDDDRALAVLATCRAAMGKHSRLLIVESVVPDDSAVPFHVAIGDLIMLTMGTGRERTAAEHTALLNRAGLRLRSVTPTGQGPDILEVTRS
jgi:SAM-dependent methyltransferase